MMTEERAMGDLPRPRISTGVEGLDEILYGGLISKRAYLLKGGPGAGKTCLSLQFLMAGRKSGEKTLFISLSETETQLRENACYMNLDITGIDILHLGPSVTFFSELESYDIFSPAEVERGPVTEKIVEVVERLQPSRVVIDAITQMRYLSTDPQQYRRQVLSFLRYLVESGITVIYTSEASHEAPDEDLQYISDGVITLEAFSDRRAASVTKFRGSDFRGGYHTLKITGEGVKIFPRLVPENHRRTFVREQIPSGVPVLDRMLFGGVERGTVTIISGPSGVGKSTLAYQFAQEAAKRGERAVIYAFDEEIPLIRARYEGIGLPFQSLLEKDLLRIEKIEPLLFTPDEFAVRVREEVEERGAQIVIIDSMAGYRLSIRGENLIAQVHALTKYMANMGTTIFLINEVYEITNDNGVIAAGLSYLSDNIIFMRYVERTLAPGHLGLGKIIGVLKKRLSDHETTIREFRVTSRGIEVGEPAPVGADLFKSAPGGRK